VLDLKSDLHLNELFPLTPEHLQLCLHLGDLALFEVQLALHVLYLFSQVGILALYSVQVLSEELLV